MYKNIFRGTAFNALRPRQNGGHFTDDAFKRFFQNENVWISIKISLKFVPKAPINNIPSLVQIMAWRRPGDKPLSEPIMVSLLRHICVTELTGYKLNDAMHFGTQGAQNYVFKLAAILSRGQIFHDLSWWYLTPGILSTQGPFSTSNCLAPCASGVQCLNSTFPKWGPGTLWDTLETWLLKIS